MSTYSQPLKILIDRCISKKALRYLQIEEFEAIHLAKFVGDDKAQKMSDIDIMALASKNEMVVFTADQRLRFNPLEREAIVENKSKVFSLNRVDIGPRLQAQYFVTNKNRILQKARKRGPMFYTVYESTLSKNFFEKKY